MMNPPKNPFPNATARSTVNARKPINLATIQEAASQTTDQNGRVHRMFVSIENGAPKSDIALATV